MKQLTKSEFNKAGTTYKSVTSPATDNETTQISDIVIKNDHLAYSTDGSTFQQLTDEVQTISSIDTIYQSPNALPQSADNGTVYATLNNGELPITLYKYTTEWAFVDQVREGVLYYVADEKLLYTFNGTSPYFSAASYTNTNQLINGADFATTGDVSGAVGEEATARENADTALQNNINAKYTKPATGIPEEDLAQAVIDSLNLADSALQSINSSDVTNALGFTPYNATNPNGYTKVESSETNGNIKINGSETTVYTLPSTVATDTELQAETTARENADTTLQNNINAKYTKPSAGIPKEDLASAVQTSLSKADTALQSITSSNVTDALGYTPYNSTNPNGYTKVESSSTNGNIKINGTDTNVYTLPSDIATDSDVSAVQSAVDTINGKIPSQASTSNQLADKDFVNSSINAFAAFYITKNAAGDPFATKAELNAATTFYSGGVARTPTTNDYCIVLADETKQSETGVDPTTRYSYQGSQWEYQYTINDTPLTAAQLAALNSGITSALVTQIGTNTTAISGKQDALSTAQLNAVNSGVTSSTVSQVATNTSNISSLQTSKQNAITSNNKLDYSLLDNTPTIPTTTDSVTSGSTAALTSGGAYTALAGKQDKLTAGTNITIDPNTNTISASGGSSITSINGLSGGSLTSPLVIKGGDAATAAKLTLDQTQAGQITNNSTATIFGFTSNNTSNLTIGHSSYAMVLRGSGTRPTYNGNSMALSSDIPTVPTNQSIVDLIYPVGSYFITESSYYNTVAKVQAHFGGTWTRVEGRFLYGWTSAGSTGGSNDAVVVSHSHTFTGNSTTHTHGLSVPGTNMYSGNVCSGSVPNGNCSYPGFVDNSSTQSAQTYKNKQNAQNWVSTVSITPSGTISTNGSSATNANMPAYRTVYMYRRTA